jgi:bifunctional non-homologous end joining protein LigD
VVRCPEGWLKSCFFQKHHALGMPEAVGSVTVPEHSGEDVYMTVNSVEGLVGLAQFGVLEIHPWLSRNDQLARPDIMIFDLDPGEGVAWEEVLGAAFLLRDFLRGFGLESFPKLTGGKGFHVAVPVRRQQDFRVVKSVAKAIAERLRSRSPGQFLTMATKAKRAGKIYLDYLRNGLGATAVAPYSLRARRGAPVAVPIRWEEVRPELKSDAFSIRTLTQRLSTKDPWLGFLKNKQSLTKSLLRELGVT